MKRSSIMEILVRTSKKFQKLTIPCPPPQITEVGNEVEEIWYLDNSRITSGILCQDFSKCLP
jgi:hypothetical protein